MGEYFCHMKNRSGQTIAPAITLQRNQSAKPGASSAGTVLPMGKVDQ